MDSSTLDVLHDSGNQDIFSVADSVHLDLFSHKVFVHKDRMLLGDLVDNADIFVHILVAHRNPHSLAAKHVGRTNQDRISQIVGRLLRLLGGKYRVSLGSGDLTLLKDAVEELSVLCRVHILSGCSHDLNAHLHKGFCQLNGGLSSELHHSAVRFFDIDDILHVFRGKRLEVQLIRYVEVCTYRLRVIVDDDRFISFFSEGPGTVYGAEVKLNTLADTDGSGTKHEDFLPVLCARRFILCIRSSVNRVIIRCGCGKLGGAGVDHLIGGLNLVSGSQRLDLFLCTSAELSDHMVREFQTFRLQKKVSCQRLCLQSLLHFYQHRDLIDKPPVDFRDTVDIFSGDIPADRFRDFPDPAVVHHGQLFDQFVLVQSCEIIGHQAVHMLFQRADRFHQSALKVAADTHYLAGSFHLSGERSLGCDKLVKRQTGDLHHAVVQHGFETCVGLARNRVGDLVQCVSQGDLRRNLGDGISGSLTCQRGRTAYTGIYFDDTVLKAVGMKGVLNVTSAGDPQLCDDIQSGRTEHLVFLVSKSLGRRYHDGVSCVYAYRVNILHIADSDTVARAVAHYFIFNLFPSGNAAFHQNFSHTGKSEAVLQDFSQLVLVVGDSTAAASQSISRTEYHRIADGICESKTVLHGSHYFGSRNRLADLLHGIFEFLTVLGFADRLRRRTD